MAEGLMDNAATESVIQVEYGSKRNAGTNQAIGQLARKSAKHFSSDHARGASSSVLDSRDQVLSALAK
jgi:hypothetical protein